MNVRWLIALNAFALGIATLLSSASALAAPRPRVVVLVDATGSTASAIGDALRAEVEAHYDVDDARPFKRKLRPEWDGVPLVQALQGERRTALLEELRRIAAAGGAGLVVLAEVHADKTERSAHVTLVGKTGDTIEATAKLKSKSPPAAEAARIYGAIDQRLEALATPPSLEPESETAEAEPTASEPPPGRDAPAGAPPARTATPIESALVVVEPELGFGMRHFDYRDRITPNQRPYDVGGAPLLGVRAELFPFARSESGALRTLGLAARYDHSFLLQSSLASATASLDPASSRIATTWSDYDLALRVRAPVPGSRGVTVGGTAGYGATTYGFESAGALAPELPAVDYRFVRLGADGRIPIGPVAVTVSADYLVVLDAGPLSDRYPHLASGGIDLGAGIAIPIAAAIELRSGVRYQRFFHRMSPEVGDANVAGGALDELARWDSGVAVHY